MWQSYCERVSAIAFVLYLYLVSLILQAKQAGESVLDNRSDIKADHPFGSEGIGFLYVVINFCREFPRSAIPDNGLTSIDL